MKTKKTTVLFHIKSRRGTNIYHVRVYAGRPTPKQLKSEIEVWSQQFAATKVSEGDFTLTWKIIKMPTRNAHERAWTEICKRYRKISTEREIALSIFSAFGEPLRVCQ